MYRSNSSSRPSPGGDIPHDQAAPNRVCVSCFVGECPHAVFRRDYKRSNKHLTIHFSSRPIAFSLDSSETPQRHAPETMAAGGRFDYTRWQADIFFTNGADIDTRRRVRPILESPLSQQRRRHLYRRHRKGRAQGPGSMWAGGSALRHDGYDDIFVAGVYRNTLYHNNGTGTLPM